MSGETEEERKDARSASDLSPSLPTTELGRVRAWLGKVDEQWKLLAAIGAIAAVGFMAASIWDGVATRDDVREAQEQVQELLEADETETRQAQQTLKEEQDATARSFAQHVAVAEHRLGDLDKDMEHIRPKLDDMALRIELLRLSIEQRQASTFSERQDIRQSAQRIRSSLQPLPQAIASEPKPDAGI